MQKAWVNTVCFNENRGFNEVLKQAFSLKLPSPLPHYVRDNGGEMCYNAREGNEENFREIFRGNGLYFSLELRMK